MEYFTTSDKRRIGSTQAGIVYGRCAGRPVRLGVSYGTVVAVDVDGRAVITGEKFSPTTSKQISRNIGPEFPGAKVVDARAFAAICAGAGVDGRMNRAPVHFSK